MYTNTTNFITNYLASQSDRELIDISTSICSFLVSCMIFIKVMDLSACMSSVRTRRAKAKKEKEKAQFEKMRVLFEAMQSNTLDNLSLSTDDEESPAASAGDTRMKMTRKKKKQNLDNTNSV